MKSSVSPGRLLRSTGFTLIEVLLAVAVVATLSLVAVPAYRAYVERAQLSQLLTQIDQISTTVQLEDALGERALQQGAQVGKAPPRLQTVPDAAFNEPGGIRLLLIRAPAGFFASSGDQARYGLVADASADGLAARLHGLAHVLPFQPGDKLWLTPTQLAFPLVDRGPVTTVSGTGTLPDRSTPPASTPTTPSTTPGAGGTPAGGTSWSGTALDTGNGNWTCSGRVTVLGTDGNPLGGNAGVQMRVTTYFNDWNGTPGQRGWNDLGNLQGGVATISLAGLNGQAGRGEVITGCQFDVTGVVYYWPTQPAVRWDGTTATIRIAKP